MQDNQGNSQKQEPELSLVAKNYDFTKSGAVSTSNAGSQTIADVIVEHLEGKGLTTEQAEMQLLLMAPQLNIFISEQISTEVTDEEYSALDLLATARDFSDEMRGSMIIKAHDKKSDTSLLEKVKQRLVEIDGEGGEDGS